MILYDGHTKLLVNSTYAGQTIGQLTGESVDGQTIGQLIGEFVDGQTIGQLTGEFVRRTDNWSTHWRIRTTDRQLVNSLTNSYDGQTIGQPTGEFVRRTDNWSTHWRICRRTDIRSTHWRFCTSHSISNIQNLFISTIHRPRPTAAPATACSPPPTSTPNINMISIIGWHGYGSIQR